MRGLKRAYDVVFFGSDHVALSTLQRLHQNAQLASTDSARCVNRLAVVCPAAVSGTHAIASSNNEKASAAASSTLPVRRYAAEHALPFLEKAAAQALEPWPALEQLSRGYSVGVVVSFGYFLPRALLERFGDGVVNMHPSLLPLYRGAAPIYRALLDGARETGVSIVTLDSTKFDAGRLLWQQRVPIAPDERYPQLAHRLAEIGADAVLDTLRDLPARFAAAQPQRGRVTHAPRVSRADARVVWHRHSVADVCRRHRALAAAFGGVHTLWRGRRLKLLELVESPAPPPAAASLLPPGSVVFDRAAALLLVRCCDGWLGVRQVCVEGKHAVAARQFADGYRLAADERFSDPE